MENSRAEMVQGLRFAGRAEQGNAETGDREDSRSEWRPDEES